jgi:hypothetical protein
MEQDPTEFFSLTEEMINSIKKDVIPRIKSYYDISSKDEYNELYDEIDHVDMVVQVLDGEFDSDKILGIDKNDYKEIEDYEYDREELWMEKYDIDESQFKLNLVMDWLDSNNW